MDHERRNTIKFYYKGFSIYSSFTDLVKCTIDKYIENICAITRFWKMSLSWRIKETQIRPI